MSFYTYSNLVFLITLFLVVKEVFQYASIYINVSGTRFNSSLSYQEKQNDRNMYLY